MALLRHLERLAIPHIPKDTVVDVDRSVRQAVRIGKQIQKRMLHEGTLVLMSHGQDKELPATTRANHQELEARITDAESIDTANCAPMPSTGKPWRGQEASSIASRTPSPIAPFCVGISLQTFRSFLDLIKGIHQIMSDAPTAPARNPVGGDKTGSSTTPNGKCPTCKAQVATDTIGPESCEEPTAGSSAKAEAFGNQPSKQQHAAPAANVDGCAVAPRSIQMEALRGTLKLLKVNLFHLVRVAAMRRACRENCVVKLSSETWGNNASDEGHEGGRRETKGADDDGFIGGVGGCSDRLQPRGLCTGDGIQNAERDNNNTPPATQGATFETLGQTGYSGVWECEEDMYGVIRELHAELRTILEETNDADADPETTNAALAVQVRSVSCWQLVLQTLSPACAV